MTTKKWDLKLLAEERPWRLPPLLQRIFDAFHAAAVSAGQDQDAARAIAARAAADRAVVKAFLSSYAASLERGASAEEAQAAAYAAAAPLASRPPRKDGTDNADADGWNPDSVSNLMRRERDDALGAKETSMDRKKVLRALGISEDASDEEAVIAFLKLIGGSVPSAYAAASDPRVKIQGLAEKRAAEKKIGFVEALKEIQAEDPALAEAVAAFYGGIES